jgi:hypothetical protein
VSASVDVIGQRCFEIEKIDLSAAPVTSSRQSFLEATGVLSNEFDEDWSQGVLSAFIRRMKCSPVNASLAALRFQLRRLNQRDISFKWMSSHLASANGLDLFLFRFRN